MDGVQLQVILKEKNINTCNKNCKCKICGFVDFVDLVLRDTKVINNMQLEALVSR